MADAASAQQVLPRKSLPHCQREQTYHVGNNLSLVEQGKLRLYDKVFGPAILGTRFGKPSYRRYVADVTVDHLLTHTARGWGTTQPTPRYRASDSIYKPINRFIYRMREVTMPSALDECYRQPLK